MSRIRSIHPGFFTDEDVVSVSMAARMLMIGIGVEADDKGVFEWKPLTIKMRLFPADNVDVSELLAELVHVGLIRRYAVEGKSYGAIKNFRKFQRPKTPNDIHPAPNDILLFVGLEGAKSEEKPDNTGQFPQKGEMLEADECQFPPKGEKSPQMEDGGCREGGNSPLPPKGEAEPVLIDEPAKPDPVAELVETWNEIAGIHGLPAVRTLSDTRRRKAAKRIAEHGLDEMRECVGRIACSPFLSGKKTDFRADFDFLVNPSKLTRLQEGFYDERSHDPPAKPIPRHQSRNGASGVIGQFTQGLRA